MLERRNFRQEGLGIRLATIIIIFLAEMFDESAIKSGLGRAAPLFLGIRRLAYFLIALALS